VTDPVPRYTVCTACAAARAAGNLDEARNCSSCHGTAMVRNPESYVCNRCGEGMYIQPNWGPHGLIEARVSGGYASPHLLDLVRYKFSLCEKCLREMFDQFKVPPEIQDKHGGATTYAEESTRYKRWQWRKTNGHIEKLKAGLCNATIECEKTADWRVFASGTLTDDACCEEHRSFFQYANTLYVPAAPITDCRRGDRPTKEQATRILSAFLGVAARHGASSLHPTYFQYVPDCVAEAAPIERLGWRTNRAALDSWAAVWSPVSVATSLYDLIDVVSLDVLGGQLLVGPRDQLERFAQMPGVVTASLVPELERQMSEPPPDSSS